MQNVLRIMLLGWVFVCGVLSLLCQTEHQATNQESGSTTKSPVNNGALSKEQQDFFAKLDMFKKQGRMAFENEMAREKTGDCPKSVSTYDMSMCLNQELEKTTANYQSYVGALRSVQGLKTPGETFEKGPSGKPLSEEERVTEFDGVEATWQAYQKAQCTAAYDAYKGGTIAPIMELTCHVRLIRDHMHELEDIYDFMH
jgi:uncharacterized protein YecT (DUF1311 family)